MMLERVRICFVMWYGSRCLWKYSNRSEFEMYLAESEQTTTTTTTNTQERLTLSEVACGIVDSATKP